MILGAVLGCFATAAVPSFGRAWEQWRMAKETRRDVKRTMRLANDLLAKQVEAQE